MKWVDKVVTFSEIPDEICLCVNISNCPYRCPGCHSSYLTQDVGEVLTSELLDQFVEQNPGISCVCIMGGLEDEVLGLLSSCKFSHKGIKSAWYTGQPNIPNMSILAHLDYIKVGPYVDEAGPLTSKTTNQRMYQVNHTNYSEIELIDITHKFWQSSPAE